MLMVSCGSHRTPSGTQISCHVKPRYSSSQGRAIADEYRAELLAELAADPGNELSGAPRRCGSVAARRVISKALHLVAFDGSPRSLGVSLECLVVYVDH